MATAVAFMCITIAAIGFDSPKVLWWYIVALLIASEEL